MVVCLLSEVPPKLHPPSLNRCGLERRLLNAAEPPSSGLIKNHITDLFVFFFPLPDLMKTKQEEVGREEGGKIEVNCLMETLSLNI